MLRSLSPLKIFSTDKWTTRINSRRTDWNTLLYKFSSLEEFQQHNKSTIMWTLSLPKFGQEFSHKMENNSTWYRKFAIKWIKRKIGINQEWNITSWYCQYQAIGQWDKAPYSKLAVLLAILVPYFLLLHVEKLIHKYLACIVRRISERPFWLLG